MANGSFASTSYTLYSLQGLRAIAACMVVITHYLLRFKNHESSSEIIELSLVAGQVGVYMFFVISGFIIIRTSEIFRGSLTGVKQFMLRRFIRVAPIYYLYTALIIVKESALGQPSSARDVIYSFMFVPFVNINGLMQPVYTLGWTLNYEMFFYMMFAICLVFTRTMGTILLICAISAVWLAGRHWGTHDDAGDPVDLIAFYGSSVILYFVAGMLIGAAKSVAFVNYRFCLMIAFALAVFGIYSGSIIILAICCIFSVAITAQEKRVDQPSQADGYVKLIGDSSYSIYLTHSFVLGPMFAMGRRVGLIDGYAGLLYGSITLLICVFVGVLCYLLIERPLILYLQRKYTATVDR